MLAPLPPNPFPESAFSAAYGKCAILEGTALNAVSGSFPLLPSVAGRLLGYLLMYASENGRGKLQLAISGCSDSTAMMKLATIYYNTLIRTFKRNKGRTPAPTDHPSRSSFEDERDQLLDGLREPTPSKAKAAALYRDDHRCLVTGWLDSNYIAQDEAATPTPTEAAHIIPFSLNCGTEEEEGPKLVHAGTVWAILEQFGHSGIVQELNGSNINRLENIMTLDSACHTWFDGGHLWLEAVENEENTYDVRTSHPSYMRRGLRERVIFPSKDGFPAPSPQYLALHALCCKVAHLSGAGEHSEHWDNDTDRFRDLRVLNGDGSNAHELSHLLEDTKIVLVC